MRVLHISAGKLYGGVESVQVTMARYRHIGGIEPEFATCFSGRLSDELQELEVPVFQLGELRIRRPLSIVRARNALRLLLQRGRYDCAICHMAWTNAIFGPVVRSQAIPLIFWMHLATDGRHWIERWSRFTPPDVVICPSEFTANMVPLLFANMKGEVIYNPTAPPPAYDPSDRKAIRCELSTSDDDVVIAQISRLDAMKGHFLHLEGLGHLKEIPRWTCWMVCAVQRERDLEYLRRLKRYAASLGIADRVRFVGERRDVPRLLAAADIYCQPNIANEGLPIIFTEALYSGIPVVSTSIGGFWETIDDSCGFLVAPGDPRALGSALKVLISEPNRRQQLGEGAKVRAREKFHPESQLPKLAQLLIEVSERSSVRPS
jgi:glycosyltransferase involved in cell wall biosynthesis